MVSRQEIQRFADAIATKFGVERIILFGSYAYGTVTPNSDVDLMVVMPYSGRQLDLAADLRLAAEFDEPVDIIIFKPGELEDRYRQHNPIAREAIDKGAVLYDRRAARVA
jgi:predicted nucleotidyltransferase